MKKSIIVFCAVAVFLLMFSNVTAVSHVQSQPVMKAVNKIEQTQSMMIEKVEFLKEKISILLEKLRVLKEKMGDKKIGLLLEKLEPLFQDENKISQVRKVLNNILPMDIPDWLRQLMEGFCLATLLFIFPLSLTLIVFFGMMGLKTLALICGIIAVVWYGIALVFSKILDNNPRYSQKMII